MNLPIFARHATAVFLLHFLSYRLWLVIKTEMP